MMWRALSARPYDGLNCSSRCWGVQPSRLFIYVFIARPYDVAEVRARQVAEAAAAAVTPRDASILDPKQRLWGRLKASVLVSYGGQTDNTPAERPGAGVHAPAPSGRN